MRTAALILAAGAALRMQQPKMLLPVDGKPILAHILEEVNAAGISGLKLVTGCHHAAIAAAIGEPAWLLYNEDWQEGMASSIRKGVEALQAESFEALVLIVSDQPFLNRVLLQEMIACKKNTGKGMVAAAYADIQGTPVLFDRCYFPKLLQLSGDTGAKKILRENPDDLATVSFPEGAIDIDTPEDYQKLCMLTLAKHADRQIR